MNTLLPYLIVNVLLLLAANRYYAEMVARIELLVSAYGSLYPWLPKHRRVQQQYQEARFVVMALGVWLSVGQWVILLGLKEMGL